MEEDLTTPDDPAESDFNIIEVEDDKDAVKELIDKHLKEIAAQAPCYSDPEETSIEESESLNKMARKVSKKSPCKVQQGAVFSGKILSFGCSECKDDTTYSPNDLLKHFQGVHIGILPTYPCDLCDFLTNEFSALQHHRIGHRNTQVSCEICNDDAKYSLLLLTKHFSMCHSLNGTFYCTKCPFKTTDAGTYVQHLHHHNDCSIVCVKCQHVSANRSEYQKHQKVHSGTFPFSCQDCGYGAARREYLSKHMITVHGKEPERKKGGVIEDCNNTLSNSSAGLKLLLKKSPPSGGASKESQWISKHNSPGVGLLDQNGRLLNLESTLEDTQPSLEKTVGLKKDSKKWNKSVNKNDQQSPSQAMSSIPSPSKEGDNAKGRTGFMVNKKIWLPVPPNCTTQVMGFKMVDGKKHLVLKVIHAPKLDCSSQNPSLPVDQEMDVSTSDNSDGSIHSVNSTENGENSKTACSGTDQDVTIVTEVMVEEEESNISETLPFLEEQDQPDKGHLLKSQSDVGLGRKNKQKTTQCDRTVSSMTKEFVSSSIENGHRKNSSSCDKSPTPCSNLSSNIVLRSEMKSVSSQSSDVSIEKISDPVSYTMVLSSANRFTGVSTRSMVSKRNRSPSQAVGDTNEVRALSITTNNIETHIPDSLQPDGVIGDTEPSTDKHERKSPNTISCEDTLEKTDSLPKKTNSLAPSTNGNINTEHSAETSPNQEVFSFHNYSKETSSISSNSTQPFENSELSEDDGISPEWSLTLAESPPLLTEQGTEGGSEHCRILEESNISTVKVSDSDIEVDECIGAEEHLGSPIPTEKENCEEDPIVKSEEECVPVSEKPTSEKNTSAALGRIVEEHSDAIISHQLEKERVGSSAVGLDSAKASSTTLRILQTPEGKKQMYLQTAENRYALPMQLQGNSGFKLITKSSTPQINVSYVKPGIKRQNPPGIALTLNSSGRINMSTSAVGANPKTLTSAVQPGASTSASHYVVNSTALPRTLQLQGTAHATSSEKTTQAQSACYLVKRPLPIAQVLGNAGSSQSPLTARPVLAMSVNSANGSKTLQPGTQAFLLRYITPSSSGSTIQNQPSDGRGNKVVLKIIRPANGIISGGDPAAANQSILLATGNSQTSCFLVSNNWNANSPAGLRKPMPIKTSTQTPLTTSTRSNIQSDLQAQKSNPGPRPVRPPSQRKRRRKTLFDELPEPVAKTRRLTSRALPEKEVPSVWVPVPKEAERTLRLTPFTSLQQIKCPRRNQPVVVLNHPDADIPEVASIMRSVNKYKGSVSKVALSGKTVQALLELSPCRGESSGSSSQSVGLRPRSIVSSTRERFILKMNLKKMSKKKYEVVNSNGVERSSRFSCWFCGRLFDNQEDWIGHGQRHLMEATRDWNKLF